MKTVVNIQPISPKYPFVGISLETNLIVLFHENYKGIVLNRGISGYKDGHYSTAWAMHCFVPFEGSVTLSNS